MALAMSKWVIVTIGIISLITMRVVCVLIRLSPRCRCLMSPLSRIKGSLDPSRSNDSECTLRNFLLLLYLIYFPYQTLFLGLKISKYHNDQPQISILK